MGVMALSVGLYAFQILMRRDSVADRLALYGPLALQEPWRLLTYAFVHGGPVHLLFNMMGVYNLGLPLERAMGAFRFGLLSLISCIGAAAFALLFNFGQATVGVSGVILGWLSAALFLVNREGRRSLLFGLGQVAIISLLPHVSWAAHLGGALFGVPLGLALRHGKSAFSIAAPATLFAAAVLATLAAGRAFG